MKKTNKDSKIKVILKEITVSTFVGVLVSLISTNFFTDKKFNIVTLVFFFIGSVLFLFISLIKWLIKEAETKKDLERQKEKLQESLKWSEMFLSHAKEGREEAEKENEKLQNKNDQLRFVLSLCGILQEEVGIDGNISAFEWKENPERKKKIREITRKDYKKWLESERDVSSLSYQLEKECGISTDNQDVGDKRQRKWVINYIEVHWRYRADKNEKIKGKTIEQFLPIYWRENFQKKEGKEIIEEKYQLIKSIDDFANSAK